MAGIVVISGCMFSGKSSQLMAALRRATYAGYPYQAFKPMIDTRYSGTGKIENHDGLGMTCEAVPDSLAILERVVPDIPNIGIDEGQFFGDGKLVAVVLTLVRIWNKQVYIAGLNLDFRGEPFGQMGELMAIADKVISLSAICMHPVCDQEAHFTQRIINGKPADYDSPLVLVGGRESYEARCRTHHIVPGMPECENALINTEVLKRTQDEGITVT